MMGLVLSVMRQQRITINAIDVQQQSLLATGCYEKERHGHPRAGKQAIEEMNRVGMIIDMSHSAERSTLEAIDTCFSSICISHTNPTFAHDALRNKSNDVIKALTARGGLIPDSACTHSTYQMAANVRWKISAKWLRLPLTWLAWNTLGIGSDLSYKPTSSRSWMDEKWSLVLSNGLRRRLCEQLRLARCVALVLW